jgi:hypothetical protein
MQTTTERKTLANDLRTERGGAMESSNMWSMCTDKQRATLMREERRG